MAGALGVRLGGQNVYSGRMEVRPFLGDGRRPQAPDVRRAAALSAAVGAGAVGFAAACAAAMPWLRGVLTGDNSGANGARAARAAVRRRLHPAADDAQARVLLGLQTPPRRSRSTWGRS
jgi:adenosylcobinamide-phosphate synthase